MLQNKFEMPLDLAIKPSKIFNFYLFCIFFFSTISVFISTSLPLSLRFLLFVVLLFMTARILKKQKVKQVTSLKLNSVDEWELDINNKESFDIELSGECIVTYFLVWLNFTTCHSKGRKKNFHLLLLPDSADKDLLRKLRVRLRFLKHKTTEENKENAVIARMN